MLAEGGPAGAWHFYGPRKKHHRPLRTYRQASILTSRTTRHCRCKKPATVKLSGHNRANGISRIWRAARWPPARAGCGSPDNQKRPRRPAIVASWAGNMLQKVEWRDGWLRLATGVPNRRLKFRRQKLPPHRGRRSGRDDFNSEPPDPRWSSLRVPMDESWCSLKAGRLAAPARTRFAALAVLPKPRRAAAAAFHAPSRRASNFRGTLRASAGYLLLHADDFTWVFPTMKSLEKISITSPMTPAYDE